MHLQKRNFEMRIFVRWDTAKITNFLTEIWFAKVINFVFPKASRQPLRTKSLLFNRFIMIFIWRQSSRSTKLKTYLRLVPRLRKYEPVPLIPHTYLWRNVDLRTEKILVILYCNRALPFRCCILLSLLKSPLLQNCIIWIIIVRCDNPLEKCLCEACKLRCKYFWIEQNDTCVWVYRNRFVNDYI
jgi:hypothetical protein